MNRLVVGLTGAVVSLFVAGVSDAATSQNPGSDSNNAAVADGAAPMREPSTGPLTSEMAFRRAQVADPWFTRASVSAQGGLSSWSTSMPVPGLDASDRGQGNAGRLAIDIYGRRLGFNLALGGTLAQRAAAPVDGAEGSSMSNGEISLAFTYAIANSEGFFLGVGPGFEARLTALGTMETGNEAFASWQTFTPGADVRARYFVSPRVFFTGAAFLAPATVSGNWQAVDAATSQVESGTIRGGHVLAGAVSASVRPAEWVALSGGLAVRDASYRMENGTGREGGIRPYVGLELLY